MGKKHKLALDARPVRDGDGPACHRCGVTMARYVHGPKWQPPSGQAFYYLYYYRCEVKTCRTQQVNPLEPEAKMWLTTEPAPKRDAVPDGREEIAAMESHFRSIVPAPPDDPNRDTTMMDEVPPWEDDPTPKPDQPAVEASDLKPFQIRVSDDWLLAVDNWRRKQKRIPSVAEAIRQLVSIGVEAEAKHGR